MVLTFTFVVCFILILTSVGIAIIEIKDPSVDTNTITQSLISLVSGILGALLGLIAGRTVTTNELSKKPDDEL
jgi:hypothetical protein